MQGLILLGIVEDIQVDTASLVLTSNGYWRLNYCPIARLSACPFDHNALAFEYQFELTLDGSASVLNRYRPDPFNRSLKSPISAATQPWQSIRLPS